MKITQKMPTPTGFTASSTMQCVLPIGLSYETLYLVIGGTCVMADFSNIQLIANGKPIQEYRTGTELNSYNVYNKRTTFATNTIVMLDLTRRLLIDRSYRELTKLGTGKPIDLNKSLGNTASGNTVPNPDYNPFPVQTLTLQADMGASVGNGATITVYALQSEPAPTGLIRKLRKFQHSPSSSPYQIADYPKGDLINAVYLNYGVKPTIVKLLRDNYTVFERTRVLNNVIQTDEQIRTPQTGIFVLDTTEAGYGDQVITTAGVNDLRLEITFSTTPTTLTSTVDYIGQLDR